MKIDKPAEKPAPAAVTNGHASANGAAHAAQARSGAVRNEETSVKPEASATIELSTTAATLLSGNTSAEFDAEKVARISGAIDAGTFKIDPEAIADKLIANAQEVLSKARP